MANGNHEITKREDRPVIDPAVLKIGEILGNMPISAKVGDITDEMLAKIVAIVRDTPAS